MRRNTFDSESEVNLPPHGAAPFDVNRPLPCRWCGTPTLVATLNQYGARCFGCYEAYCQAPQVYPRYLGDKLKNGNLDWAHALMAREQSGERLTKAQREMWRAALKTEIAI